jgi:multicomponent Na+:H+ antiporter subunit C
MWPFLLAMLLLAVGLYGIVSKKNLIKIVVGLLVVEYAVNLFLLLQSWRPGPEGKPGIAPILTRDLAEKGEFASRAVDPLPQAMILTSIVIGLGVAALMVAIAVRIHEKYGTFDMTKIRKLKG